MNDKRGADKPRKQGHTPGPWEITDTLGQTAITIPHEGIGLAPYTICHVWPHIESGDSMANAALIAAAPELLEACKIGEAVLWKLANDNPKDERFVKAFNKVTEAILKAERAV